MIKPTIHNNGSDPQKLIDAYLSAAIAVCDAIDKLQECAPHSRDYYIQGIDAMNKALEEHVARVQRLILVRAELHILSDAVSEQVDLRNEQRRRYRESMR